MAPSPETMQKLSVPQALTAAAALLRQGRLPDAERIYSGILKIDAHQVTALHHLGVIRNQQGRAGEALTLIHRALEFGAPNSARNDLGIALAALGRNDEAIAEYRRAIAAQSNFHEARNNLGTVLQALGQHGEAVSQFEQALACKPVAEVHNNLGISLSALDRPADAVAHYEKAIGLKPNYGDAHRNLARALAVVGRHEDAVAHFQTVLAIAPDDAALYNDLGNALGALGRHSEAVVQFQKAIALKSDFAEAYNNLGSALAALEQHPQSVAAYRRALALKPEFFQAHCNIGRALAVFDESEEAIAHFRSALAIKPDLEAAYADLGVCLAALGRTDEMLAVYNAGLAVNLAAPDLYHSLGYAFETLGRLEDSRRAFAKAIDLAPGRADLYRGLAESKRFTPGDPHLIAMEGLAARIASLAEDEQIGLHFALGSAYEDVGQPERAFTHLLHGNALRRRRITYDEAETFKMFERIASVLTPELIRHHSGAGAASLQPTFIVGMPRSGTTLVEQMLASHPDIFGAGERKDFSMAMAGAFGDGNDSPGFPERLATLAADDIRQIGARYLDRVAKLAPGAARITDKMPANFRFAGIIHLALPNARIVHVRRDPIDTCLSCFSKLFAGRQPYTYDLSELGRYYRAYESLMAHWRRVLPADVMLELQYEELVADFEVQARRIVEHCGLEWDERCLAFHETQRPVRTASATQVRQPLYRSAVGRWHVYEPWLGPLRDALNGKA